MGQGYYLQTKAWHDIGRIRNDRLVLGLCTYYRTNTYLSVLSRRRLHLCFDIIPDTYVCIVSFFLPTQYSQQLCIKSIDKDSIFKHTVLKPTDHIISINGIVCDNVQADAFAHVVQELTNEITITVLRRKQRFSGMFK